MGFALWRDNTQLWGGDSPGWWKINYTKKKKRKEKMRREWRIKSKKSRGPFNWQLKFTRDKWWRKGRYPPLTATSILELLKPVPRVWRGTRSNASLRQLLMSVLTLDGVIRQNFIELNYLVSFVGQHCNALFCFEMLWRTNRPNDSCARAHLEWSNELTYWRNGVYF